VVVNAHIVIAVGMGLVIKKFQIYLWKMVATLVSKSIGQDIFLQKWVSLKEEQTQNQKFLVEQFDDLKEFYLLKFNNVIGMDEVPEQLVINGDQRGINYVPVFSCTMEQKGTKRVELLGKDELTALFASSMSGDFLPIQLVY